MFREVACKNPQCIKKEIKTIILFIFERKYFLKTDSKQEKTLSLLIAWPMSEECLLMQNAKATAAG